MAMLNISREEMVTISKREYDDMQDELRKLRNQVILDGKLMEGLSSVYREGTVDADEALGRLGAEKFEGKIIWES
ncbi:hypothetical protein [Lactococcus petauri]|uniref:Antitoxin VbhA domain-containing protein n=1 Tax=Lactococcus petauri TaxID=1940789 RepID=A0ABZ2SCT5_9LACT|nr:hypothetical protein [Lactococcus petauri]OAL08464.1 hypothetical protein A7X72_01541 [Lactococcus garvieae]MCI3872134.1 hypothetical protein [Lactococcus petauri]MCQ8276648.1 hypothetical protein [Lactococcus petauri]MCR6590275.1 hypothetical protein [Lactococcus petauri]MCU7364773.1 hypothetical protein [Lactococcus petauri]